MKFFSDCPNAMTLGGQGQDAGLCRLALPLVYLLPFTAQPGQDGFCFDTGGGGGRADRRLGGHAAGLVSGDQVGDIF